jgi:hypothetical protein
MEYDEGKIALVSEMLKVLDPQEGDDTLGYVDQLRRVQDAIVDALATPEETPAAEDEQVLRQALGRLDPKAGDDQLGYGEVLWRLLSAVDKELFKWDSSMVQPPGPSGDAQVALIDKE